MKWTKQDKKQRASDLARELRGAGQIFFANYQGLKFEALAELRRRLKPLGAECRVVKNSLIQHAIEGAGIAVSDRDIFRGPLGMVLGRNGDPVGIAGALFGFSKDFPALKIRAGYVASAWLDATQCQRLSTLGSRLELLRRVACVVCAPLFQIASVLQAPLRDGAMVVQALKEKRKQTPAPPAAGQA